MENRITEQEVQNEINEVCDEVALLLTDKNRKYGNSAIEPLRIFSRSDAEEQINVRIDDKLSRIKNRQTDDNEDAEYDLIGYLILKRVRRNLMNKRAVMEDDPEALMAVDSPVEPPPEVVEPEPVEDREVPKVEEPPPELDGVRPNTGSLRPRQGTAA